MCHPLGPQSFLLGNKHCKGILDVDAVYACSLVILVVRGGGELCHAFESHLAGDLGRGFRNAGGKTDENGGHHIRLEDVGSTWPLVYTWSTSVGVSPGLAGGR